MVTGKFTLGAAALLALAYRHAADARSCAVAEGSDSCTVAAELTDEQIAHVENSKESMQFQTEVARMLDIIINSLYTKREVFLRELISNAADALEKARYLSVSDPDFLKDKNDLSIYIDYDAEAKTITITDTGLGMSRADLINNLGTLAKSGTTNFLEAMAGGADLSLIGQFGVGFYSSFLVADKVTVLSKKPNEDQYIWESSADAQFSVVKDPRGNTLGRGTQIILHLKDDATEFAADSKIQELIDTYSKFVNFPIYVSKSETVERDEVDLDAPVGEDGEHPTKKVAEIETKYVHINTQKPIWSREKDQVSKEEYIEFYKTLTKDTKDPIDHIHFSAEGDVDFKSLLYIPGESSNDKFASAYHTKTSQVKLFVRRVLVNDGLEDLLPKYLHFLRGVVDSDDVPLNVSREQLQQSRTIKTIAKTLVKRSFDMMTRLSKEEDNYYAAALARVNKTEDELKDMEAAPETPAFLAFYKEHGRALKMGCYDDDANRNRITKILRFKTLHHKKAPKVKGFYNDNYVGITLDQYIENMPESQKDIYFVAGDNIEALSKLPHLQAFKKKNYDVILLTDAIDEPCLEKTGTFNGKRLVNIQKGDVKFDETDDEIQRFKKLQTAYKPLTEWMRHVLRKNVGRVEISKRLVEDPVTVAASQFGYSAQMEKVMRAQAFGDQGALKMFASQRTLEINPNHPMIVKLLSQVQTATEEEEAKAQAEFESSTEEDKKLRKVSASNIVLPESAVAVVKTLFQTGMFAAGFEVENPNEMASSVFKMLNVELGLARDAPVEEFDVSNIADEDAPNSAMEKDSMPEGFDDFNFDDLNMEGMGAEEPIRDEL